MPQHRGASLLGRPPAAGTTIMSYALDDFDAQGVDWR